MEVSPADPTTAATTAARLRLDESIIPSTTSTPIAATPTTISFQLDAEADAELYSQDAENLDSRDSTTESLPLTLPATIAEKSPLPSSETQSSSGGGIPGLFLISDPLPLGEDATEEMAIDNEHSTAQSPPRDEENQGDVVDSGVSVIKEEPAEILENGGTVPLDTDMPDKLEGEDEKKVKEEEEEEDDGMIEKAPPPQKDPLDPDFIAAGEANKNNAEAEWQLDSSDSDTSSDSSSDSDSDSEAGSDDYPMMDQEQLAKLLMREDGGDDEDSRKEGVQGPLKTKNEIPEEAVPIPRPAIVVTPEMKTEILGAIETIVGTMVLIKAFVSGDHQVLNEGSLLCFEDRSIVGVVADTFGRVEEPLYTVRFNSPEEISETGASVGQKVFYVPQHSDYVFTQALKGLKGSDASNIFDEEVGEAEREFSDDEAEAEYKRQRKYARQAQAGGARGRGRGGGSSGGGSNDVAQSPNPTAKETDELYTPLTRPANLAELMNGPPPLPPMNGGNRGDRGHQRGGRNDRGGRGRGRGGQRGGRGRDGHEFRKRDRDGDQGRGDYQDRDENTSPSTYQSRPQNYNQQSGGSPPTYSPQPYSQGGYQPSQFQQQPQQQPQQFQNRQFQPFQQQQQWTPPPNFPQFPQFPGYPQQGSYQQYPHAQPNFYQGSQAGSPGGQFPPALPQGAHVNPAFFRGGQQQQSVPAPPGRNDFNWSPPVPQGQQFAGGQQQQGQQQGQQNTEAAFKALQNLVSMSNQMRNSSNPPPQ